MLLVDKNWHQMETFGLCRENEDLIPDKRHWPSKMGAYKRRPLFVLPTETSVRIITREELDKTGALWKNKHQMSAISLFTQKLAKKNVI